MYVAQATLDLVSAIVLWVYLSECYSSTSIKGPDSVILYCGSTCQNAIVPQALKVPILYCGFTCQNAIVPQALKEKISKKEKKETQLKLKERVDISYNQENLGFILLKSIYSHKRSEAKETDFFSTNEKRQENCYSQSLELCHIQENQDIILLGSNDSFKRSGAKKKKLSTKKKRQLKSHMLFWWNCHVTGGYEAGSIHLVSEFSLRGAP
ncbi:hypothetical protein KUTeg_021280 [Tegillarca granosa]|uniref:Uncharacterized protein n=1 Tax=Tegillarca granosa TaxID=220873 RepID=A0ABQ9EGB1_TEGGR|nr:hypothetical protein KUTeg_021280 [Tegillarca granosa]